MKCPKIMYMMLLLLLPCIAQPYQRIFQLAGSDFYTFSTAKQCYVPAHYNEAGEQWLMHPEQLCLDNSDVRQLIPITLSKVDSSPYVCPPDRPHCHHFSKCCGFKCCPDGNEPVREFNPMQGLIDRYFGR